VAKDTKLWDGHVAQAGQPYDRGYDVASIPQPDRAANAILVDLDTNERVPLWIFDVQTNFALAGSTGQSADTRTFFPRNFVQPTFAVQGQATQYQVGAYAEFVRKLQLKAVQKGTLARLTIPGGGVRRGHSGTKGTHAGLSAQGYVRSFGRIHEQGRYVVDYSFDFVVSRMESSLFNEQAGNAYQLATWLDIVNAISGNWVMDVDTDMQHTNHRPTANVAPGPAGTIGNRPT
jgi:hypothetical protein